MTGYIILYFRCNLPLKLCLKSCHSLTQQRSFLDSYFYSLLLVSWEFAYHYTSLTRCVFVNAEKISTVFVHAFYENIRK